MGHARTYFPPGLWAIRTGRIRDILHNNSLKYFFPGSGTTYQLAVRAPPPQQQHALEKTPAQPRAALGWGGVSSQARSPVRSPGRGRGGPAAADVAVAIEVTRRQVKSTHQQMTHATDRVKLHNYYRLVLACRVNSHRSSPHHLQKWWKSSQISMTIRII